MTVVEWVLAALALVLGLRATLTPVRFEETPSGSDRLLVALYEAARAGFWFALAGLFAGFALLEDTSSFKLLAVVPVVLAGIRMLAAVQLARR
ncbi:MAG TPA: hypothetical protein VE669_10150 [Actinomycetota bacterium]|nr:hypothetical protein [Actinomycetota bacterium]